MTTYFDIFNIKSDLQLSNIMNNLELTPNEMFALDDIINGYAPINYKREKILEMFSGTNNYNYCRKLFLKEDMEMPSQLNMNQTIELNELFALASEKFKKVNCSQQFYQMLSQKTSKNFANAFFNMLKSIPEDSNCRFDPNLTVDGKNFAETIYPFVNELKTFLNGCKSESKKEEVKESIETQPDMFGGPDTYYKDGIEALDFDNVLDAMNKVAPEMDFVDDRDVKGKYSMIFQPKSSGLELNQKGLKKIKDYLSQKFGKENIAVRLAHSQYAPEIKKLYVTFINQIDVQNDLNESLDDTLNNFKYFITSSSNKKELEYIKDKLQILFNGANDTESRNEISELLSMINSKLNKIKPTVNECCELSNLLEPFKPTVINITVNDDGCLEDVEKENAVNQLKALASHINDKKDCCEENNLENIQTINTLLGGLVSYFNKRLCESVDRNMENAIESINAQIDDFGSYDDEYIRSCCEEVAEAEGLDVKKLYYYVTNRRWSVWDKDEDYEELDEDFNSAAKKVSKNINKGLDKIHYATVRAGQKLGLGLSDEQLYEYFNEYLVYVFMFIYGLTYPDNSSFKRIYNAINDTDWNMEKVHKFVMKIINNKTYMKEAQKNPKSIADFMKYQLTHYGIDRKIIDNAWDTFVKEELNKQIDEMCSGGACCAGAVATVPSPVKPKLPKRKHKKTKVDEMALNMFKRQIIEDVNGQINLNGNHYEYKNGYFYINGDIAKTKSKYKMLESLDENIELETLPGFNSEEMKLLEDIEASGSIGSEDDNNQNNNSGNNNNANNNNNQQNNNQNINQNNLGDVEQNVTQDNDLTPQQRQLKKDTEQILDQSMNSGSDTEVSVNQGLDNNNNTTNTPTPNTNNIKYKVIGKDDSDSNNIKYIIQDPNSKQTMMVDATKLRLEK